MIHTDPEILEDDSPVFDGSATCGEIVEIAEEVKATHRTMAHERRSKEGQRYNLDHFDDGINKVYLYRLPSVLEVGKRARKAKHIDHYVGPAAIVKRIGNRSFQISLF